MEAARPSAQVLIPLVSQWTRRGTSSTLQSTAALRLCVSRPKQRSALSGWHLHRRNMDLWCRSGPDGKFRLRYKQQQQ